MKKIVLLLAVMLSGCSTQHRILQADFDAAEYNDLSNKYNNMLTKVIEYPEDQTFAVSNDGFGEAIGSITYFSKEKIDEHILMVNKFIKWHKLAIQRGDRLTNKIGVVHQPSKSYKTIYLKNLEYSIHETNILVITTNDGLSSRNTTFNYLEAVKFRDFLVNYKNGTNTTIDLSVYN